MVYFSFNLTKYGPICEKTHPQDLVKNVRPPPLPPKVTLSLHLRFFLGCGFPELTNDIFIMVNTAGYWGFVSISEKYFSPPQLVLIVFPSCFNHVQIRSLVGNNKWFRLRLSEKQFIWHHFSSLLTLLSF